MNTQATSTMKQISQALMDDPRTSKAVIEVGFANGIATLTGLVKNAQVSAAAEEIARQQPGVLSVVNELKLK